MTAFENIASPLARAAHTATATSRTGVDAVAKLLKIDHVLGHAPRELSNGQKQRTALARALVASPQAAAARRSLAQCRCQAALRDAARTAAAAAPARRRPSSMSPRTTRRRWRWPTASPSCAAAIRAGRRRPRTIYRNPATVERRAAVRRSRPSISPRRRSAADGTHRAGRRQGCHRPRPMRIGPGKRVTVGVRPEAVAVVEPGAGAISRPRSMAVTPLNERTVLLLADRGRRRDPGLAAVLGEPRFRTRTATVMVALRSRRNVICSTARPARASLAGGAA